jgi:hypothetical protein
MATVILQKKSLDFPAKGWIFRTSLMACQIGFATMVTLQGTYAEVAADLPNPEAVKAYKQFWDSFAEYEGQKKKSGIEEFERMRDGLKAQHEIDDQKALENRLEKLQEGIAKYERHLKDSPRATNRPYVLLNLAQMYAELAGLQEGLGQNESGLSHQKSLALLKEIEQTFPDFENKTEALYLRAIHLEKLNRPEDALVVWRSLAQSQRVDRYTLHANLACGDFEFQHGNAADALRYYERAGTMVNSVSIDAQSIDRLRVQYRIGWAAYKATQLEKAIAASAQLLDPGLSGKAARQKDKIIKDAIDLVGFSLYEQDDYSLTRTTLRRQPYASQGAAIGLTMLRRYQSASQFEKAAQLGVFLSQEFGGDKASPESLIITASAQKNLGRTIDRVETLEKLALFLPERSLWRAKFYQDLQAIKSMEELARAAALTVASWHYENGLASNAPRSFASARGFYGILVDHRPTDKDAIKYRINIGNCLQFEGQYEQALVAYSDLTSHLKVSDDSLSVAMYQRTVTLERLWRQKLETAVQKGVPTAGNTDILKALNALERGVEEHANKFPNQSRSVDLLLVAASANRDLNRFTEASKFWQRALLAQPSDVQRSISIRGLVFAQLRAGKPRDVIDSVTKFLKLENTKTLSQNLRTELEGVLSSATNEEGQRLAKMGQNEEAGEILLSIATEFKTMPNREQLYRDGAYMLAIGGQWPKAQHYAQTYVEEGLKKHWGDMTYLVARSHEFQMRFPQSVDSYLELAEREPGHSRAAVARERAEKLAVADGVFEKAARACILGANAAKEQQQKLDYLSRATEYHIQRSDLKSAMATATRRRDESRSESDKLGSSILVAKVQYASGDRQNAVDDLDSIVKQIERTRFKLGDHYPSLSAEAQMALGEDLKLKFDGMRLSESNDFTAAVAAKSKIFENMTLRFDAVAALDQKELSPKARYLLATSANDFADEIAGLPARTGEALSLRSDNRFQQNVTRLKDVAKKYHSNNVLAKQRSPQAYAQNEWIRKSALILSSTDAAAIKDVRDQTTSAIHMEVPQQWNF